MKQSSNQHSSYLSPLTITNLKRIQLIDYWHNLLIGVGMLWRFGQPMRILSLCRWGICKKL